MGNIMDELPMVCSVRHSQMHGRTALQFVLRSSQRGITQLWAAEQHPFLWCGLYVYQFVLRQLAEGPAGVDHYGVRHSTLPMSCREAKYRKGFPGIARRTRRTRHT